MIEHWKTAFALTVVIESIVVLLLVGRSRKGRVLLACLLGNGVSHPALWFWFPGFGPFGLWALGAELAVTLFEAAVYVCIVGRRFTIARALRISVLANVASVVAGLVLL